MERRVVELSVEFEGFDNATIVREINSAIDLVLSDSGEAREYLEWLIDSGSLPLRFTPC